MSPPWREFDAVFIGGDTAWKLGPEARRIVRICKEHGKHVHMGRVFSALIRCRQSMPVIALLLGGLAFETQLARDATIAVRASPEGESRAAVVACGARRRMGVSRMTLSGVLLG